MFLTIDLVSVYISYILIVIINLVLVTILYFQINKRFPGTFLLVLSVFITSFGNIFAFLRNVIPDWISITLANLMIVSGLVMMLIALEKFVNKKGCQLQNYILIFVFFIIHTYFTYINPDIRARHFNFSFPFVFISLQIAYLMLKRAPVTIHKTTRPLGFIFIVVAIFHAFRMYYLAQNSNALANNVASKTTEAIFLLVWESILILAISSLFLMYIKRLILDINTQEEKFSKAFHAAPFLFMLTKLSDGEIFEVNKKIVTISGYLPEELIGVKTVDLKIWEQPKDRLKFISNLKTNGSVVDDEYMFRKKSGELFPGLISAEIVNINNEPCIISIINDITVRKQAKYKLLKSEASLKELNSTKDKFFSIIAHDLKSPFNGILGFSEILSEQVKANNYEGIDEYAEIINTSSKHAVNLLSNLMEWAMSQTGKMDFNPEYVDVVGMIKSITALLKTALEEKAISVHLNLPTNMILYADKRMIEVVFRNLISNAIKFTPKQGTISVDATEKEDHYIFSIVDNGVGIQENHIEKLFRIDSTYSSLGTNNERGTGLGLILCKDFIDYHKGKIWVESEHNVGSKFYVSIPKSYH